MKDLKILLFEEALYHERTMGRARDKYGVWNEKYYTADSNFHAVFYVIEKADLTDEYLLWKKEQIGDED